MVFTPFPQQLTEEEELLQQKYAKLKKKKKALAVSRAPKVDKQDTNPESKKRPAEAAADATEQAKKLLKSGVIRLGSDKKEQQTFKRTVRSKDTDKSSVSFQPFSHSQPQDFDEDRPETSRVRSHNDLYKNFVPSSESRSNTREERPDFPRREFPRRGNTVYVNGPGITEDLVRTAFSGIGTIAHIIMEPEKSCAFVTFESMDSADKAIAEVNGSQVSDIKLRVSMARRQPNIDTPIDVSTNSWAAIATSNTDARGGSTHKDQRDLITYDTDDMF